MNDEDKISQLESNVDDLLEAIIFSARLIAGAIFLVAYGAAFPSLITTMLPLILTAPFPGNILSVIPLVAYVIGGLNIVSYVMSNHKELGEIRISRPRKRYRN